MKYEEEYLRTENKKEFIELASKYYVDVKRETLVRRYYDLRKKLGEQRKRPKLDLDKIVTIPQKPVTEEDPVMEPDMQKKMVLEDMKRMGYKLEYNFLRRYGFSKPEINWLRKNGEIE